MINESESPAIASNTNAMNNNLPLHFIEESSTFIDLIENINPVINMVIINTISKVCKKGLLTTSNIPSNLPILCGFVKSKIIRRISKGMTTNKVIINPIFSKLG